LLKGYAKKRCLVVEMSDSMAAVTVRFRYEEDPEDGAVRTAEFRGLELRHGKIQLNILLNKTKMVYAKVAGRFVTTENAVLPFVANVNWAVDILVGPQKKGECYLVLNVCKASRSINIRRKRYTVRRATDSQ
jgi:hypothetical protein